MKPLLITTFLRLIRLYWLSFLHCWKITMFLLRKLYILQLLLNHRNHLINGHILCGIHFFWQYHFKLVLSQIYIIWFISLVETFDILNELGPFCNFEIDDVVEVKIEEGAVESFGDQFESVDGLDDSQISFKLIYSQVNILLGSNTFLINFNNTRFNI